MSETIVVSGAAGHLGRQVVDVLAERGYSVRALVHHAPLLREGIAIRHADLREEPPSDVLEGADCLVACAGAPIRLEDRVARESFDVVDYEGNERLFQAAGKAGVRRVVYVSLVNANLFMESEYVRAHEKVVSAARQSTMMQSIVRSTQLFSMFTPMVAEAAARGCVTIIGDGTARTNPISERDLAEVVADTVRDQPHEVTVGGPETFTRERIAGMACEAAGVAPCVKHKPVWLSNLHSRLKKPFNPRLAEAIRFHAMYNEVDAIADARGTRYLAEAFASAR